jgi:hypothetical protein
MGGFTVSGVPVHAAKQTGSTPVLEILTGAHQAFASTTVLCKQMRRKQHMYRWFNHALTWLTIDGWVPGSQTSFVTQPATQAHKRVRLRGPGCSYTPRTRVGKRGSRCYTVLCTQDHSLGLCSRKQDDWATPLQRIWHYSLTVSSRAGAAANLCRTTVHQTSAKHSQSRHSSLAVLPVSNAGCPQLPRLHAATHEVSALAV